MKSTERLAADKVEKIAIEVLMFIEKVEPVPSPGWWLSLGIRAASLRDSLAEYDEMKKRAKTSIGAP